MRRVVAKDLMRIAVQEALRTKTRLPVPKIYKILKKQYKTGILKRVMEGKNVRYKHMPSVAKKREVDNTSTNESTHTKPTGSPKVQRGSVPT